MNFSRIGKYLLIPFAIIISFIPVIDPFNLFNNLKNSAFDIFQNISPRQSISAESVLILDIDEESLSKLGQWPWPRTILSDLVDKTYLSAVLGFDVVFAENDRTGSSELKKLYKNEESLLKILDQVPNSDNLFSNSIANHGTCLLYTSPSPRDLSTSRMPSSA